MGFHAKVEYVFFFLGGGEGGGNHVCNFVDVMYHQYSWNDYRLTGQDRPIFTRQMQAVRHKRPFQSANDIL